MPNHPQWGYKQTMDKIHSISDERLRNFARINYYLGGRIIEMLSLQVSKIEIQKGVIFADVKTLKTRRGNNIYRKLPNIIKEEPYYVTPLIRFSRQPNKDMTLEEYIDFGGKRWIEIQMMKELGIVPHSLRHLRATHMGKGLIPSSIHKPTASHLKYYFGWSNIATANEYVDGLTVHDILRGENNNVA